VQGLGGVGGHLAELLVTAGAVVVGADLDPGRAKELADRLDITVEDPDALYDLDCDVFSPNAIGGVLNEHTIPRLRCRIVAGGANNQLATAADGRRLLDRGILYAPDYVINAGGVIHAWGVESLGWDHETVETRLAGVGTTLTDIYEYAEAEGITTEAAAEKLARSRLAQS
jgi:leucine dehydrogenase